MEELLELRICLEQHRYDDALAIVSELEEMSKEDKINKIGSFVKILLIHIIKRHVEQRTTRLWDTSIANAVYEIRRTNLPFFLISLKAGGVGLNLTAADYVIHVDPWWNPAVEMQATDRTHRIGQDKPVFVYKLVVRDSVEEKVLMLQERKRAVVEQVIATEGSVFKELSPDDIESLFT